MIRVHIRAVSPLSRKGLEQMLGSQPGIVLVSDSMEAEKAAPEDGDLPPDVSIVEVEVGEENSVDLEEEIDDRALTIMLVDRPTPAWMSNALRWGAKGIVPRGCSREQLVAAIYAVANGLAILHPDEIQLALPARGFDARRVSPLESMTRREMDVLAQIADGLANKEIAERLKISEHTVKFHVASIMGKLGATSRTEAVTIAIRRGMLLI